MGNGKTSGKNNKAQRTRTWWSWEGAAQILWIVGVLCLAGIKLTRCDPQFSADVQGAKIKFGAGSLSEQRGAVRDKAQDAAGHDRGVARPVSERGRCERRP